MNKRKTLWTFIGFMMFMLGMVSLAMDLVATPLGIMEWTKAFGRIGDFLVKLFFVFGGVVFVVLAHGNDDEETDEYLGEDY